MRSTSTQSTQTTTKPPRQQRNPRSPKNTNRRVRRQNRSRRYNRDHAIPAAYVNQNTPYISMVNRNGTSLIITRELFPFTKASDGLDFLLPISPSKWVGTRTAQMISTYGSYRPVLLEISWQPAVGTQTDGTVALGTVFNGNRMGGYADKSDLLRYVTSTGNSIATPCYATARIPVKLGTSLSMNVYPTTEVSMDDIPLWIVGVTNSTGSNLGNVLVSATFAVHNPQTLSVAAVGGQYDSTMASTGIITMQGVSANIAPNTLLSIAPGRTLLDTVGSALYYPLSAFAARVISNSSGTLTAQLSQTMSPIPNSFASYIVGRITEDFHIPPSQ